MKKELAARRIRMFFTEKIIDGKQKRLVELEIEKEQNSIKIDDLECAFSDMKEQRDQKLKQSQQLTKESDEN